VSDQTVTYQHAATCTLTAHQAGDADYDAASDVTRSVSVAKGDQHLAFSLPAQATVGDTLPLTATRGASGQPVSFTLSQTTTDGACSISDRGTGPVLTLNQPGTCAVTAHEKGNADYNDAPDVTQSLTVGIDLSVDARPGLLPDTVVVTVRGLPSGSSTSLDVTSDPSAVGLTLGDGCVRLGELGKCTVTKNPQTFLFIVAPPNSGPTTLTFTVEPLPGVLDTDPSNNTDSVVIRP
jgi:hypothetical protein